MLSTMSLVDWKSSKRTYSTSPWGKIWPRRWKICQRQWTKLRARRDHRYPWEYWNICHKYHKIIKMNCLSCTKLILKCLIMNTNSFWALTEILGHPTAAAHRPGEPPNLSQPNLLSDQMVHPIHLCSVPDDKGMNHSPDEDCLWDPHSEVLHPRDEAQRVDPHAVAHPRYVRPADGDPAAAVRSSDSGVDLSEIKSICISISRF